VSSFGGSPSRQEIGLGDATAIDSVEIFWPVSNVTQQFPDLQLDSSYVITEGVEVPRKVQPVRTKLGGG
jgi:hypothetical protein